METEGDQYLSDIIAFLKDELERFSPKRLKKIAKVADLFALDVRGVLYRLARSTRGRPRDAEAELRLVVRESLREDMLHYAHDDFQGGHQRITRTHEKLRSEFYWPGIGKGSPPNAGPSPGNIEPTRHFEAVSMDFVTHLPESVRGNTFLLLFQDMFSGYVMCKPMASTTAQAVAEAYDESVFRRFGASSVIRHDQDPRFMREVFARFRDLIGSKQGTTLAYRPQANGQQERSVQTVILSVKAYVAEADQSDWDEHVERLMFALNTSFDATRLVTPFYLVHGWDAHGTVSAMLGPKPSTLPERTAYGWRHGSSRETTASYLLAQSNFSERQNVRGPKNRLRSGVSAI
ncbi:Reverse transcriptase [Phytophthora palmivora]|uniref:Reverse transcriptase n=1 Tax=Phytophthora palmivora TaxID=4796 RepID=A0A2P4WYR7_9STRA|nr:Reverse transcriptase [Phytophthora palmivora]